MENAKCYAPQILVGTEGLPREQWLEYRRKGIGGSDAAAVLGISPFRTGRDLYYDKLNIVTADDAENWVQLEVGTLLEPLVAKIFAHKTGYKIYRRPFMFRHPQYPWMLADLDYMVELPDGTTAILEIKTTNYNAKDKDFNDVSDGYWAAAYIKAAAKHGWINGYGDGSFRADDEINRAEVVTIVNRLLGREADEDYIADNLRKLNTFPDVSRKHWAYYAVMEAANAHTAVLGENESWSK